jgi:predicted nucleic acid-binding protein
MVRVFLDANVFVYAEHIEKCNSKLIVDMAETGEVEVVVSDALITEVKSVFQNLHGREVALNEAYFIESLPNRVMVSREEIKERMSKYKHIPLKEFDFLHFIASVAAKSDFLITSDKDFFVPEVQEKVKVVLPKNFVEIQGLKPFDVEY